MKNRFLVVCLAVWMGAFSGLFAEEGWRVVKNSTPLSYTAEFLLQREGESLGKVVRSGLFTPRYHYDLLDAEGNHLARGVTRAFSLGMLAAWGTEIDLYDANGQIGWISGTIWTTSRAKFAFYDAMGELIAHANLHDDSCDFLLVSEQNKANILAEFSGKTHGDTCIWEMKPMSDSLEVDPRLLQVFGGFVADFQKSFVRPPRTFHHYHYQYNNRR
ncbi:MAG: hypothetical protein JSS61_06780 [Verrucomicrobia bacterium]|nr:hypothetical protein [Verrucomicrobiota bacterium]